MPDKKKKVAVSKKSSTTKASSTTVKKKSPSSTKTVKKEEVTVSKKTTTVKPKISKKTVTTKANKNKSSKASTKKTKTVDTSKKKVTTKKVPKASTIQQVKEDQKKELDTSLEQNNELKENKTEKNEKVKVVSKKEKKNNKIEKKKTIKLNVFVTIKEKLAKKKDKSKPNKAKKQNKKKIDFTAFKNKLFSKNKKVKNNNKTNNKVNKKSKSKQTKKVPLFTKKTKIWLFIVAIVCAVIIIAEVGYLIYRQIDIDRNTVYYDSLNSLVIDETDIVAVGSSNFRYSKNYSYTKGLEKAKLIKYDKSGKIIFEKMYENGINTTFSSIISVNDGYIVVGSGEFSEEEQKDGAREAIIIKYDKEGNIVWEKYYQVVTNTRFNKVIATSDGYIAIGQSIYANMEMGNHTTGGGIIVKYDFDGNEVWRNNHGGMKSGNFNDIVEVNGDFYVVGKDATDSANVVKFDKNGQYKWHKNYSYTDGIGFTGIAYLDNALYVVGSKKILPEGTGDEDSRNTTNTDALLVKYDLEGKIIFEKNFGGSNYERYNSILAYRNNLYIVGHTTSKDAGLKIVTDGELMTGMLVRYDKNGNILKKSSFGGSNNDNLTDIVTDSASIYITAYSNSEDGNITTAKNNGKDYFGKVIKLDFKFRTLMVK